MIVADYNGHAIVISSRALGRIDGGGLDKQFHCPVILQQWFNSHKRVFYTWRRSLLVNLLKNDWRFVWKQKNLMDIRTLYYAVQQHPEQVIQFMGDEKVAIEISMTLTTGLDYESVRYYNVKHNYPTQLDFENLVDHMAFRYCTAAQALVHCVNAHVQLFILNESGPVTSRWSSFFINSLKHLRMQLMVPPPIQFQTELADYDANIRPHQLISGNHYFHECREIATAMVRGSATQKNNVLFGSGRENYREFLIK
ncbi:MAG: hypothetical protein GY739_22130, partial [Mesoflavibacter sp.]|nr:hypothetical protein [Mesoflavibacter sp.]